MSAMGLSACISKRNTSHSVTEGDTSCPCSDSSSFVARRGRHAASRAA